MNTIINVECVDQELIITNSPTLASGGICENIVSFKFCNKWDGFSKTAVFYQNEKNVYYALINDQNECEVPHEVTMNEGTLHLGVFGVNGDARRTSKVDKIRIHKGAWNKDMHPSDPTPDIYTQLQSEMNDLNNLLKSLLDGTNPTPVGNAKTLESHEASYFATAQSVEDLKDSIDESLDAIEDGTTPVGDSNKLGGKGAREYASADGSVAQQAVGYDGYIAYPEGGKYYVGGTVTGSIRITLPCSWLGTSISFKITLYDYYNGDVCEYFVGGYLHSGASSWTKVGAMSISANNLKNKLPVGFAHDGTNCVITIGETSTTWKNFNVTISDISCNWIKYDVLKSGWIISITSDNSDLTVSTTVTPTNYLPLSGAIAKEFSVSTTAEIGLPTVAFRNNSGVVRQYLSYNANNGVFERYDGEAINVKIMLDTGNVGEHALLKGGGELTGILKLAYDGYRTNQDAGYSADRFGNLQHLRTEASDYFQFRSNDGSKVLKYYPETGEMIIPGNLRFDGQQALHTGNSAKVIVSQTPLTSEGSIRVW